MATAAPARGRLRFLPTDFRMWTGLDVPDPITFIVSPKWLDRPNLYPRQATLLKVIFLREDLFTDYDYMVVAEWEASFREHEDNGIVPDILVRMRILRERGYKWFREVLLVLGRRAGKGYVSALAMSYVLWNYMALGDPQEHYGVDRDKQLSCMIYAGKKEQAKANLWQDLANVVMGAPCFQPYVPDRPLKESLEVFAPNDFVRLKKLLDRGIKPSSEMASFALVPKEATVMSGRGPASFMQGYDEFAHMVTAGGASRSGEEVYNAATPSLDQFHKDAFIIEPSSPWQMIGQFFANWKAAQEVDEDGTPAYPTLMFLQLASWEIYYDWETAHELDLLPRTFLGDLGEYRTQPLPRLNRLKGAIQTFDEEMARLEAANPETFAVERRSHWQAVVDAYLDPNKVEAMFDPWNGRTLQFTSSGVLSSFYKGHADPSRANANFGIAIAHPEYDEDGQLHCVFDYVGFWRPADFPDNTIDYVEIEDHIWDLIQGFKPDEFTFDQWNSAAVIDRLQMRVRRAHFPKRVDVHEKTATAQHNWERAEAFKTALNQGWVHSPYLEQAEQELKFLQLIATNSNVNRVEKQETGPVTTKDVADCLFECCWTILGEQVKAYTGGALAALPVGGGMRGGADPYMRERPEGANTYAEGLGGFQRSVSRRSPLGAGGRNNPARSALMGGRNRRRTR